MVVGLIGACGVFWDRDVYDWSRMSQRRLLGRRGLTKNTIQIADFSGARGIYVLYNEVGVYYVGLTAGDTAGLSARLSAHTTDRHAGNWTRFSWFSFDSPSVEDRVDDDGVLELDYWTGYENLKPKTAIEESEAMLIAALKPQGNEKKMRFKDAEEWTQVAINKPEVRTFDEFRARLLDDG